MLKFQRVFITLSIPYDMLKELASVVSSFFNREKGVDFVDWSV